MLQGIKGFFSIVLLTLGALLCGVSVYLYFFSHPENISYKLAWLPALGLFAAFWVDHGMLRKQNKKLLNQTKTKSDFISVLSHDLKTPLARIKAMVDVISSEPTKLNYEQKLALLQLEKSQTQLINFIDEMVQMSHLDGGSLKLNLKSSDINQVITTVVKESRFHAEEKNIEIVMELEPLFSFKFDPHLIKQVIQNLVENALKYSDKNTRVLISSEDKNDNIVVQITDQGMGISSSDLKKIFNRYFRSKKAKDSVGQSSGLGLYLSNEFVKLHNGQLLANSKEGIGSTFTLSLPKKSGVN